MPPKMLLLGVTCNCWYDYCYFCYSTIRYSFVLVGIKEFLGLNTLMRLGNYPIWLFKDPETIDLCRVLNAVYEPGSFSISLTAGSLNSFKLMSMNSL